MTNERQVTLEAGARKREIIIAVLLLIIVVLTAEIIRLESYHYRETKGFCERFDFDRNPLLRLDHDRCLERFKSLRWYEALLGAWGIYK